MKRTQIYLSDSQQDELDRRAKAEGETRSPIVRRDINDCLDRSGNADLELGRFRAAIQDVAGTVPRLPQGAAFVDEIRAADVSRHDEIERRRRE